MISSHPLAPLGSVLILPSYSISTFTTNIDADESVLQHAGSALDRPPLPTAGEAPAVRDLSQCAVLCRNTAPLLGFAFALLRRGIPCHVLGREIQIGLEKIIEKFEGSASLTRFKSDLVSWGNAEQDKLIRKGKREAAELFDDKIKAILVLAAQCISPHDVKRKLAKVFASGDGLTLSTIHKAKGLEWETVFLLDWFLLPSKWAMQEWEKVQEANLQYVAVTRAKLNIRFINSDNWKDQ